MEQKTKKRLEMTIFGILGLIALMSGSMFCYQLAYAEKIYPHVTVANIDLKGKTKEQATELLDQKYKSVLDEELTLKTTSGEIKTKVSDTGLGLDVDKTIDDSFKVGRGDNFFVTLYQSFRTLWVKNDIKVEPLIDQDKYNNFLKIAVDQLNTKPQDAALTIENGEIKTVSEQPGISVNVSNLMDKILSLAGDKSDKVIILDTSPVVPAVKASDFQVASNFANNILVKQLNLTYNNKTYTPTKNDLGLWIAFVNNNGVFTGSINENNVMAYLNKIAKDFEIAKKDKKINQLDGSIIEEGRQGLYLDKNNAILQIKAALNSSATSTAIQLKTYTQEPSEVKVIPAEGLIPGRFEGKYIDVDLTLQKLCEIDGTNIVACYTIS